MFSRPIPEEKFDKIIIALKTGENVTLEYYIKMKLIQVLEEVLKEG